MGVIPSSLVFSLHRALGWGGSSTAAPTKAQLGVLSLSFKVCTRPACPLANESDPSNFSTPSAGRPVPALHCSAAANKHESGLVMAWRRRFLEIENHRPQHARQNLHVIDFFATGGELEKARLPAVAKIHHAILRKAACRSVVARATRRKCAFRGSSTNPSAQRGRESKAPANSPANGIQRHGGRSADRPKAARRRRN